MIESDDEESKVMSPIVAKIEDHLCLKLSKMLEKKYLQGNADPFKAKENVSGASPSIG